MPVDLKKKYGPLSPVGWGAVAAGTVGAYILYKRYQANAAANAAAQSAAVPALVGSTVPGSEASGGGSTVTTTTTPTFSSLAQWEQAAIAAAVAAVNPSGASGLAPGGVGQPGAGYNNAAALNDITDWLNGQCVSAEGYTAISSIIGNAGVGLPPGFGSVPTVSVCPQASTTPTPAASATPTTPSPAPAPVVNGPGNPPNLPASIAAAMTTAGEVLGGAPVYDAAYNEWLFFTNKGGIYNIGANGQPGAVFNGSYEGLPAADKGPGPTGSTNRTFSGLSVNPDGTYTLTDTLGEGYTFTPSTPQVGKAA